MNISAWLNDSVHLQPLDLIQCWESIFTTIFLAGTGGQNIMEKTVRLLVTAGILMLLAGAIFGSIQKWIYAALVWIGAFGCLVAALNFKNRKDDK